MNMVHAQFLMSLARANWWTNAATNGHASTRKIIRGDGHKLTQEELRDDAMTVAQTHMQRAQDCLDLMEEVK